MVSLSTFSSLYIFWLVQERISRDEQHWFPLKFLDLVTKWITVLLLISNQQHWVPLMLLFCSGTLSFEKEGISMIAKSIVYSSVYA